MKPNKEQRLILQVIHDRCVAEATETADAMSVPLLRLISGLPGSGKSQLIAWVRSSFEDVWDWQYGREFAFIAPLNTMAAGIGGQTVQSFGNGAYKD